MKKQNNFLLWISFFLTTSIVFGMIVIPSFIYWVKTTTFKEALMIGGAGSILFGIIYSTYKLKTLYSIKIDLDFNDDENCNEIVEKELLRIGYRVKENSPVFTAGFRADYYMSPDILVEQDGSVFTLTGPKFYLNKLKKRHLRQKKRALLKNRSNDR